MLKLFPAASSLFIFMFLSFPYSVFSLSDDRALLLQNEVADKSIGERIAFFAEQFVGTPYDDDPLGAYVRQSVIVTDEKMDCMYLVFRSVELASSSTPQGAVQTALEKRFHSKGVISNGKVINYDDRFAYGEDMISSGKWGKEITSEIGMTTSVRRVGQRVDILSRAEALKEMQKLRSGDIIFFIKDPDRAVSNEIVGHIGIIKKTGTNMSLIHAGGRKGKGGRVKEVILTDYLKRMPFTGIKITRFP